MARMKTYRKALALAALLAFPLAFSYAQDEAAADDETTAEDVVAEETPAVTPGGKAPVIEATVDDIDRLIALPEGGKLAAESDEDPANPKAIFKDANIRAEVFGESPIFVYYPDGPDPMIIPWIRQQIVAQELLEKARLLEQAGDNPKAMETYQIIVDNHANTPSIAEGRMGLERTRIKILNANTDRIGDPPPETPTGTQIELPKAVADATSAIYYFGSAGSQVIIFDEILSIGDKVPRHSGVVVKDIQPGMVTFQYQGREFPIQVDGSL
jgi:hypothetical protein